MKAHGLYSSLYRSGENENVIYPALFVFLNCFAPIIHAQTVLESATTHTTTHALPTLEILKRQICMKAREIATYCTNSNTLSVAHNMAQLLAQKTLDALDKIEIPDLWVYACFMHPGFCSFSFAYSLDVTRTRRRGEQPIQSMLSKQTQKCDAVPITCPSETSIVLPNLGKERFRLCNVIFFLPYQIEEASVDESSSFLQDSLSDSDVKKLQMDDGLVDYWVPRCSRHPKLSQIALHILATLASSSSSESDFSALKLKLNIRRILLANDLVEDLSILKSSTLVLSTSAIQTILAEEL